MAGDTSELQAILHKIETLETANRRLRRTVLAVALVAVVMLGLAQVRPSRSAEAGELLSRHSRDEGAAGVVQSYGSHPAKGAVVTALKDTDYALRRFQEVTGQVNFGRWDVQHYLVEAAQKDLEAALGKARTTMARIDAIQAGESVSALDLFEVYDGLAGVEGTAANLANGISEFDSKEMRLATDLFNVASLAVKTSGRVRDVFREQIQAEESELEACRSKPQH